MWCANMMPISLSGELTSYQRSYFVAPAIFEKFAGREFVFTLRTSKLRVVKLNSSEEYVQIIKEVAPALSNQIILDFEYFSYTRMFFEEMLEFPNLCLKLP